MGMIKPDRHELYAQYLAKGMTQDAAYAEAGYKPTRAGASRLASNANIIRRIAELQARRVDKVILSKHYVLEASIENAEKALGRKPVKITRKMKVDEDRYENVTDEVFVYEGQVANAALKMLGSELGMFVDRKDFRIVNEFDKLTDAELAQKLVEVGQMMLEGPVIEHEDGES